jgi:hypothetical protein
MESTPRCLLKTVRLENRQPLAAKNQNAWSEPFGGVIDSAGLHVPSGVEGVTILETATLNISNNKGRAAQSHPTRGARDSYSRANRSGNETASTLRLAETLGLSSA